MKYIITAHVAPGTPTPVRVGALTTAELLAHLHEFAADGYDMETITVESAYEVGEPDPTPDLGGNCPEDDPTGRFHCTWVTGHDGQHVAGTGTAIVAVWS